MMITHGDSTDQRPDLQPGVVALRVSQDGGVPCVRTRWEGHPSDLHVFQARAQALMTAFAPTPSPRYLVADAQRDHADKAPSLKHRGCITRLPPPLRLVSQVSRPALEWDPWHPVADHIRDQRLE